MLILKIKTLMIFVLINIVYTLSWNCQYDIFGDISSTHFLYKEDNVNQVKWLEKYEYCRAKGDPNVYNDAGQGKCENSRGLCYWNNDTCENTNRDNDPLSECQNLINDNILVELVDEPIDEVIIDDVIIDEPIVVQPKHCRRK